MTTFYFRKKYSLLFRLIYLAVLVLALIAVFSSSKSVQASTSTYGPVGPYEFNYNGYFNQGRGIFAIPQGPGTSQTWRGHVTAQVAGNGDTVGLVGCLGPNVAIWQGSCWIITPFVDNNATNGFNLNDPNLDIGNEYYLPWKYWVLEFSAFDARWFNIYLWADQRQVSIDTLYSSETTVNTNQPFNVCWKTSHTDRNPNLSWSGAITPGNDVVPPGDPNESCRTLTAGNSPGTIQISLDNVWGPYCEIGASTCLNQIPKQDIYVNVIGPTNWIHCNGSDGSCSIPYNNGANLDWDSTNTAKCELYRNWAAINTNLPTRGGYNTGNLTQNWEYELVCKNSNGGFVIDKVQVNVGPPVPGCTDPPAANYNSSANVNDGSCKYWVNLDFNVNGTCGAVSGATVTINQDFGNGTTKTTDGSGFQNFGVYNNTTIGWTVSKSGYTTQSGSVTTGSPGTRTTVSVNMGNSSGVGGVCTETNACGQSNTGTTQCGGGCSVSAPPNPPGYGIACTGTTSPPNACGQTNPGSSGTIQCDGSCSGANGITPSNSSCPVPAASISCTPGAVGYNGSSTIAWSCTNSSSGSVSPSGWTGTSGSQSTGSLTSNRTYALTCVGFDGSNPTASCPVTVSAPTVDIKANNSNGPITLAWNSSANLSWTSANAGSCNASGDWSGSKALNSSQSTGNLTQVKRYTYTLTCSGNGSASDTVYIDVSPPVPNAPTNVTVTPPDYCISGPAATITWTYSDPSGGPQSAYEVQMDEQGSFQDPEYQTGKVFSSSNSNFTGQGILLFNKTYKTRIRVWNSYDQVSDWTVVSGNFNTPPYPYPQIDFYWTANSILNNPSPPLNKPVSFIDTTVFNGNPNGRRWSWNFGDTGTSTSQNPSHTYAAEGSYYVTLTATDNANQSCARTKGPLIIQKPIPRWREIAPK